MSLGRVLFREMQRLPMLQSHALGPSMKVFWCQGKPIHLDSTEGCFSYANLTSERTWDFFLQLSLHCVPGKKATVLIYKVLVRLSLQSDSRHTSTYTLNQWFSNFHELWSPSKFNISWHLGYTISRQSYLVKASARGPQGRLRTPFEKSCTKH